MVDFPSQSHKAREPREVQPVTRAPAKIGKPPTGRRLRQTFFQGDAGTAWGSMIWESFIPGLRDQIEDALHEGLSTLLGGGSSVYRRQRNSPGNRISRHNPDRAIGSGGSRYENQISRDDRRRQDTSAVEFDSRAEAEACIESLNRSIDSFDVVTLAEFYELVQHTPDHTDYKFGWDELGGARVVHSRGAYHVELPPVITLK